MQSLVVEVKPLQMQRQQIGEGLELESLVGVALAAAVVAVVLVVTVQDLWLHKAAQSLLLWIQQGNKWFDTKHGKSALCIASQ